MNFQYRIVGRLVSQAFTMESQSAPSILLPSGNEEENTKAPEYELPHHDVPPNIDFYRLTAERIGSTVRPSMKQLIEGVIPERTQKVELQMDDDRSDQPDPPDSRPQPKKFGWIEGVFVRCFQNIIGVILFLRLSWVAGEAGLILGSLIIILATVVTTIAALSTSAITSNGEIKGGGAYYMISRTLGPEFGGSIGIIFCCANAAGGALYVVGFAETALDIMKKWDLQIFDGGINDIRIIGVVTCSILMGIIVIGISIESKMQQVMLIPLFIAISSFVVGSFIHTEEKEKRGFTGYSWDTFSNNLLPTYTDGHTFFSIFSIFFPAATGIMAGANISGDLKDPQTAIPKGTILAIFTSTLLYLATLLCSGSTFVKISDGLSPAVFINGTFIPPDCPSGGCNYGLLYNFQVISELSVWSPLIVIGIFASTVCSALASLLSAPKIIQAVARDDIYPKLKYFSKPSGKNNDPRRAYALTFLVTIGMILIGDLNRIAPIIANFFLCTYVLVNYSCFDASYSENPGFRPGFKYYSMWVSLLGSVLCVVIMFIMDWKTALATFMLFGVLYVYIKKNKPDVNWGLSTQATKYKATVANLYSMNKQEQHVKNYRPQVLLLSGDPSTRPGLVDFAASITRGSSLMICANVLVHAEPTHTTYSRMHRSDIRATEWLKKRGIKSFSTTVCGENLHKAAFNLIQMVGIGKLTPNILMIGYKSDWIKGRDKLGEINDYVKVIQAGFDKHMSVAVLRNRNEGFNVLENESIMKSTSKINKFEDKADHSSNQKEEAMQRGVRHVVDRIKKLHRNGISDSSFEKSSVQQKPPISHMLEANGNRSGPDVAHQHPSAFAVVLKRATIDVWWLSDDGGLTLLLPHLLTLRRSFMEGAEMRVFTFSTSPTKLDVEHASMAAMMNKFRISYKALNIISETGDQPSKNSLSAFNSLIAPFRMSASMEHSEGMISDAEIGMNTGRTNRHLRCGELLREHSQDADLIVVTLPVPTKGTVCSSLYLAWLEMMTRGLPPTLLVRGNHNSVLTFYS